MESGEIEAEAAQALEAQTSAAAQEASISATIMSEEIEAGIAAAEKSLDAVIRHCHATLEGDRELVFNEAIKSMKVIGRLAPKLRVPLEIVTLARKGVIQAIRMIRRGGDAATSAEGRLVYAQKVVKVLRLSFAEATQVAAQGEAQTSAARLQMEAATAQEAARAAEAVALEAAQPAQEARTSVAAQEVAQTRVAELEMEAATASAAKDEQAARGKLRPRRRGKEQAFLPEEEKMTLWARQRWEELWDKKSMWCTGPVLVASDVPVEVFHTLTMTLRSRKMNLRYEAEGKKLFICGDGSHLHECARDILSMDLRCQFENLGFQVDGGTPNILVLRGGRVEFPGGIEEQIDVGIYEFRPGESADTALTPFVLEVVYLNESLTHLLRWLETMCETPGSSTRVAVGIYFPLANATGNRANFKFSAFVKKRGQQQISEYKVNSQTEDLKIELEVKDLFTYEDARSVVEIGEKFVIDLVHLRKRVLWTVTCPFSVPGYNGCKIK